MKKTYLQLKEETRQKAIEWQNVFDNQDYCWGDIAGINDHFYKLGKRYGLLKEFRENGIC